MASCILYQNSDASISIIDIPSSIKFAQVSPTSSRRLLSSEPLTKPFPSVEPKSRKAKENLGETSLDTLFLSKHLQFVLEELKAEYHGEWCLSRAVLSQSSEISLKKRKNRDFEHESDQKNAGGPASETFCSFSTDSDETGRMPPNSTVLCGEVVATRDTFASCAPNFDLIIMDPPWPNRSARRKKSYGISYGSSEIRELLSSIPIGSHLSEDGTVGVWVTNKDAFKDMLLQPGGLFEEWGIVLAEEWIWLKTTLTGEPICPLDSAWRKPYEIMLIGKRGIAHNETVKRRVLIGVPDLHSRKPNLKALFDQRNQKRKYEALEIFARNMTAGWWGWGNEALKFQMDTHWINGEGN
ncbi:MT-A70-domain-containing protein [Mollisia scopiformis]|uniref:MT-A70-domain-containing protein n=1 Tax=Mollisia scopiformis TaxID=149040 RepID=A0A132B515_MOLSC|nr:MT-A70-domain-containing protein [Mollisia scopiformis]KUJ06767.1 MT-A70-domain-containing protein [Mollisia scopiformis]